MKHKVPSVLVLASLALPAIAQGGPGARVTLCHNTHSQTNPVVVIAVSENAVQTHLDQHGDELFVDGVCGGGGGGGS